MKIVSLEEVQNRISKKYPSQPFEIISYTRISKEFEIKCLCCGQIKKFSSVSNFLGSKREKLCNCYSITSNEVQKEKSKKEILNLISNNPTLSFIDFSYRPNTKKNCVQILCQKCGIPFEKTFQDFKKNCKCPHCETKKQRTTESFSYEISNEYHLLEEYINDDTPLLVQHSCGFVWKTRPKLLLHYCGCPKCNKSMSKGERKILNFLVKQKIDFTKEKSFSWQSNSYWRYDFFLPDYNLIIEYNGSQHYIQKDFFQENLSERQKVDAQKELEAKNQGYSYLIIPYTDYKKIDEILTDWFNDYLERE